MAKESAGRRRLAILTAVTLACLGGPLPAAATMYVYQAADGSRLVSNVVVHEPGYRLIHRSPGADGVGAVVAGRASPRIHRSRAATREFDSLIKRAAEAFKLDPALIKAVIHAESGFDPKAISRKGATGLMQLMPQTARQYGVSNSFNPEENVFGGTRHLKDLLLQYDYNHHLALAAYNAGAQAVARYSGIPPYAETQNYVQKVMLLQSRYATKYW
jgi:soluble lytic murein transglycosylase-like protein